MINSQWQVNKKIWLAIDYDGKQPSFWRYYSHQVHVYRHILHDSFHYFLLLLLHSCIFHTPFIYFVLLHVREMVRFPFLSPSPVNSVTTTWQSRSHTVICSTNIPITTTATKCVTACRIAHKMYKAVGPSFVPWRLVDTFFHIEMVILFSLLNVAATMRWTSPASWVFICASVVANGKMACLTVTVWTRPTEECRNVWTRSLVALSNTWMNPSSLPPITIVPPSASATCFGYVFFGFVSYVLIHTASSILWRLNPLTALSMTKQLRPGSTAVLPLQSLRKN